MIERYIYAVTRELPRSVREQTSAELRKLIFERTQRLDQDLAEDEKIREVLGEMGNPKLLATQYRGRERYLIGPKYFDRYVFVLKVVLLSILLGLSLVHGFSVLFSVNTIYDIFGGYVSSLLSAMLQGAAWVTGIFALLEYNDISLQARSEGKPWDPSQLPPLPQEKARISRGESIFAIVFSTLFLTLFFFAPEAVGIYWFSGNTMNFVPIFNLSELAGFRLLIFLVFTLSILVELIKIIKGRWTRTLSLIIAVMNLVAAALLIYALTDTDLWNSEMILRFERFTSVPFNNVLMATVFVIVVMTVLETFTGLYRGFRYGEK